MPGLLYSTGALGHAAPGLRADDAARDALFTPNRYRYEESANTLPLTVLVDYNTGSAAEEFAAVLQDNAAAIIAGEATGGAGCCYTNGGE